MPNFTYIFPPSGSGFDRSCCLTSFAPTTSGTYQTGYLGNGEYQLGNIYTYDGNTLSLDYSITGESSSPTISSLLFGSWVFTVLGGQLPTIQPSGGFSIYGGGYGGISWNNIAFTGNNSLSIQASWGGVVGWDSNITSLNYTITGSETFSWQYQILDTVPDQVELQIYEATSATWHIIYVGATDLFGFGGTPKGNVASNIGQWNQVLFTLSDLGLVVGDRITGVSWGVWQSIGTSTVLFSDTVVTASGGVSITTNGFIDATTDNVTGFYLLGHQGPLVHIPIIGQTPQEIEISNTSFVYTGLTFNPVDGNPYFIGYDGTVYNYNGSSISTITSPPGGVVTPARWLYTDSSNNLYTMFSNSNSIASYDITANTWSVISSPFGVSLDTITYSNSLNTIIVGGTDYFNLNYSASIVDLTYSLNANQILIADNSPAVKAYDMTTGGWSFNQTVSGFTGIPTYIAATPDGTQVLVSDSTNNQVEVLSFAGDVWSQTSIVSLTNPTSLATITSGVPQALICQPTQNTVTVLDKSGSTWSISQTLPIANPNYIAVQNYNNQLTAIVATSTGVTFADLHGALWVVGNSLSLSPAPVLVAVDSVSTHNPYFYGVANNGSNIIVYIFQNGSLLDSYTISNDKLGGLLVLNYQIFVPTISGNINGGYYVAGVTGNELDSSTAPVSGTRAIFVPDIIDFLPQILMTNTSNIWSFYNDSPQSLTRITDSKVAVLSGISWSPIIDVQDMNVISSLTTDVSGNIFAVNTANVLYKWSSSGALASGYPALITPPTGQQQGVPLGFNRMIMFSNKLYAASCMLGGLVAIEP